MMPLSVTLTMSMVIILHEHSLIRTVRRKRYRRNSQSWRRSLKSVPAGEWAGVSPCFTR